MIVREHWEFQAGQLGENFSGCKGTRGMMGVQWFRAGRVFRGYINIFGITWGGGAVIFQGRLG